MTILYVKEIERLFSSEEEHEEELEHFQLNQLNCPNTSTIQVRRKVDKNKIGRGVQPEISESLKKVSISISFAESQKVSVSKNQKL